MTRPPALPARPRRLPGVFELAQRFTFPPSTHVHVDRTARTTGTLNGFLLLRRTEARDQEKEHDVTRVPQLMSGRDQGQVYALSSSLRLLSVGSEYERGTYHALYGPRTAKCKVKLPHSLNGGE